MYYTHKLLQKSIAEEADDTKLVVGGVIPKDKEALLR
jgi:methylmalonyl-CoA mutase cobalamin-binding subunit